jgi:hypothetical protein
LCAVADDLRVNVAIALPIYCSLSFV